MQKRWSWDVNSPVSERLGRQIPRRLICRVSRRFDGLKNYIIRGRSDFIAGT